MSNTRSTRTSSSLSSDWTDKENIPVGKLQQQGTKLENGRSNDSLPSNSLDRKRQEWEIVVHNYKGEDPLKVWRRYLRWTQQNYPAKGREVTSLLERCIGTFKEWAQYKNDERYVLLWLNYIDCANQPVEIFSFLQENSIGIYRACLYEAHAIVLETQGRYQEATEVYEKGIKMLADPLDRLKKHFTEFQGRMDKRQARLAAKKEVSVTKNTDDKENVGKSSRYTPLFGTKDKTSSSLNIYCDNKNDSSNKENVLPPVIRAPSVSTVQPKSRSTGQEVPGYLTSLVLVDGVEYSFEELRASHYGPYIEGKEEVEQTAEIEDDDMDIISSPVRVPNNDEPPKLPTQSSAVKHISEPVDDEKEQTSFTPSVSKSQSSFTPVSVSRNSISTPRSVSVLPSPSATVTIHTKEALEEVEAMFSAPLGTPLNKSIATSGSLSLSPSPSVSPSKTGSKDSLSVLDDPLSPFGSSKAATAIGTSAPQISASQNDEKLTATNDDTYWSLLDIAPAPLAESVPKSSPKQDKIDVTSSVTAVTPKIRDTLQEIFDDDFLTSNDNTVPIQPVVLEPTSDISDSPYQASKKAKSSHTPSENSKTPSKQEAPYSAIKSMSILDDPFELSPSRPVMKSQATSSISIISLSPDTAKTPSTMSSSTFSSLSPLSPNETPQVSSTSSKKRSRDSNYDYSTATTPGVASIDPFDGNHQLQMLINLSITMDGFFDCTEFEMPPTDCLLNAIQNGTPGNDDLLPLAHAELQVDKFIGKGVSHVFLVKNTETFDPVALKVSAPPCPWEYYMNYKVHQSIEPSLSSKFCKFQSQHVYNTASFTLMDYSDQGNLQNLMNLYKSRNLQMDETLSIYYATELMRMVATLHSAKIIHTDLTPENLLILHEENETMWEEWQRGGTSGGWSTKGLRLIDFHRSIDMSLYPEDTVFYTDVGTESLRCIEMQIGKPWNFQIDYYGICNVLYFLISGGEALEVTKNSETSKWEPVHLNLRNMVARDLWTKLFQSFLNIESCMSLPSLSQTLGEFENYILADSSRVKAIKAGLCRQNIMIFESLSS